MWRCTRLALLLTTSLKLTGLVQWHWTSVFWPGWVTLSMLSLISIGVLLLVFGSVCAWASGELRTREILCVSWFFYVTAGSSSGVIALLILIAKTLDGEDFSGALTLVLLLSSVFSGSVYASTLLLLPALSSWWDTFFYALDSVEEARLTTPSQPLSTFHARKVSRQLITVGQATPKLLVLST